jgi:hypothetical protein
MSNNAKELKRELREGQSPRRLAFFSSQAERPAVLFFANQGDGSCG